MLDDLPALAHRIGRVKAAPPAIPAEDSPFALKDIYTDEIEALAQRIYQRDYLMFGFQNWA
jgi:hypothetical protein